MSKIYLINVGANTGHQSIARCPLFENGSFTFVSYPHLGIHGLRPYPPAARPFVRNFDIRDTHSDPDWQALTYGDDCGNPRATALRHVVEDDVLLFWALLWRNTGNSWASFTGERSWGLIGALRVREILGPGQRPKDAKNSRRARAKRNVHLYRGELDPGNYVFIGCTKHSRLFPKAIDLGVRESEGLLYQTIRSAHGDQLSLNGKPKWSSSLRSCREIWNLAVPEQRKRAEIARDAISRQTGYDLLNGL